MAGNAQNPHYALHRQKAFLVPGVVPPAYLEALEQIPTWEEWDPDQDRWYYDWHDHERFLQEGIP